ncbi:unnamed protein product, partial [Didymodactylos carnosus]
MSLNSAYRSELAEKINAALDLNGTNSDEDGEIYRILLSFANAFRRTSSTSQQSLSQQPSQPSTVKTGRTQSLIGAIQAATQTQSQLQHHLKPSDSLIKFKTYLDIKEDDGKGNFVSVQRPDKNVFKLRKDVSGNNVVRQFECIKDSLHDTI